MKEINDPAAPSACREAILIDRMKSFLLSVAERKEEEDRVYALYDRWTTEEILHRIEEMDVSGDDSVVELTSKLMQCIEEMNSMLLEHVLLEKLEETIKELYPELWVVNVWGMGIVIADSVWESKFAPHAVDSSLRELESRKIIKRYIRTLHCPLYYPMLMVGNQKRLQVYTDIHVERCFAKWQEKEKERTLTEEFLELPMPLEIHFLTKMYIEASLEGSREYFGEGINDQSFVKYQGKIYEERKGIEHQFMIWQGKIYEEEKENRHSHPPNHDVIKIDDNGVLKVDKRETKRLNTFLKFYGNRIFQSHSTDENRVSKWAALYGMQWAQLSVLGNPLDKLSQSTGIDTMELSMGKACSITVWTSIFFLNFLFAAMLTWSLPLRIPAYSMLGFSLLYYILALIVAMSGYSVAWGGSAKMSGLLFVFGGATSLVLLLSIIIIGVLYGCSSPNEVGGELTEKHSPECIINFQDN
ncbi:hypothetical protein HKD37_03G007600 [Glycine soja]